MDVEFAEKCLPRAVTPYFSTITKFIFNIIRITSVLKKNRCKQTRGGKIIINMTSLKSVFGKKKLTLYYPIYNIFLSSSASIVTLTLTLPPASPNTKKNEVVTNVVLSLTSVGTYYNPNTTTLNPIPSPPKPPTPPILSSFAVAPIVIPLLLLSREMAPVALRYVNNYNI